MKKGTLLIFFCFVLSSLLFANGATEARLYYLPMNVANNNSVAIEMSRSKSVDPEDLSATFSSSYAPDNLVVCRLMDALNRSFQNSNSTNTTITIESKNDWEFVHENNTTIRVPFEIEVFCTEQEKNSDTSYTAEEHPKGNLALSTNQTLTYSRETASLSFDSSLKKYTLTMPTSTFTDKATGGWESNERSPDYIRNYDICIKIPNDTESLLPGYYETTITLKSSNYYEGGITKHSIIVTWYTLDKESTTKNIDETITLRGYVGDSGQLEYLDYSFVVQPSTHTYSMDLGITKTQTYSVANVSFNLLQIVTQKTNNPDNKFTIYISPTRNYASSDYYQFILNGSENKARTTSNTIHYDLYLGNTKISNGDNKSNAYSIKPSYTSTQISGSGTIGGGGQTTYREAWVLDQEITLKLTTNALKSTRSAGMYYSYIYFTLIVND